MSFRFCPGRPSAGLAITLSLLIATGCSTAITPEKAVERAAAEPTGREGTVRLTVASVYLDGETGGFFLGTTPDRLDPKGMTVFVSGRAAAELAAGDAQDPRKAFLNREILVNGIVRKVRVGPQPGKAADETPAVAVMRVDSARQIVHAESREMPRPAPMIDIARAKTADYITADPASNVVRALYMERLQKRIDKLFSAELFAARLGSGIVVQPGSSIRLEVIVMADGRLAADVAEIKSQFKHEPELAFIVLNVLMKITAKPEPFPPALVEAGFNQFRYEASFSFAR